MGAEHMLREYWNGFQLVNQEEVELSILGRMASSKRCRRNELIKSGKTKNCGVEKIEYMETERCYSAL